MGYLDSAGLQYLWGKLKEKFAPKSHNHDDRYYTEAEMDGRLSSKVDNNEAGADGLLSKLTTSWTATPTDDTYFIRQDTGGANQFGRVKFSTIWNYIKGKTDGVYQPKGNYSTTDTKNTAGSTNTTSKLYLIGSTSQSANSQTYSNASVYTTGSTIYANGFGNDIFIIYPSGGSVSYGGEQIGYCKITLPTLWDSTMMTFTVTIYNYVSNTSVDYRISGYNYAGKPWYNCAAVCVGKAGTSHSNLSVRFGDNGTKNVITIGEENTEWEYPRIVVHDVVIGNSNFETYKSGWNVEISKSGAPNVSETISNTHVGYNAVTSWDKIQNKPSSFTPASHTHDDRYYTETEMNAKLDGKSNTWHTHDDRYYTESEMNAKLAEKSNINHTHNSIKDAGDGGTLTLAYSKSGLDYGSYSWLAGWNGKELRAVNKNQFATAYHTHDTSSISAGNANYAGGAGPIESAHIDVLRANRLAFLPASGVKVEYSVDGGTTWVDYGATDDQKASLFAMRMGSAASFYTGKHTKADECTIKDQLRITVTPVDRYASVNMLYLWVSVAGTSATVNISRSTIGAKETFTDVRTDVPISGWSGPNEIRFSGGTFGGGSTQTSNAYAYRFTFKNKADGKGSVSVMDIRMYGPSAWGVPNNMMEKDHIYNWDANQNVHFPAQVTATRFNGSSTGVVDYGDSNGSTIKIGFGGAGLTKDKLTHIAGYAKDGNQTVIKDVSKGVLQSWLDLGASAYKKVQSLSAVGHSNWTNQSTDDGYVPTMAFMAFWNGAFNGSGNSNLQYCDRGRFGTIVTKNSGDYAIAGHTHNYAGSGTVGGSANSAVKLDSSAGSATQPVYFKDGKPVATTYALNKTVPADAKFTDTDTWRGIQNNLTSDSTDQSLSAAQGKALKTLVDGKAPASHKHTKSQITDFPTSMPASDVSAWAKAATKPSYTKAEVGLSNVDNTADKDKSVKYATSAGSATTGLNGVSTCIFDLSSNNGSCVRFYNGLQICFGNSSKSSGVVFKLPFANDNYAVVVGGSDTLKNAWYVAGGRTTTGFNPNQNGFAVLFHWIAIGNWK